MGELVQSSWDLQSGLRYSVGGYVDVAHWDAWWQQVTYDNYRRLVYSSLMEFRAVLARMFRAGRLKGYEFLMEMPEYEQENWIRRAQCDCNKCWQEDPEGFPPCGIKESFDRIRAVRKERSQAKKEASKLKKLNLGT